MNKILPACNEQVRPDGQASKDLSVDETSRVVILKAAADNASGVTGIFVSRGGKDPKVKSVLDGG